MINFYKKYYKYIFMAIFILGVIILCVESLKTGSESSERSDSVADVIEDIIGKEHEDEQAANSFRYFIRKSIGHFGAFFVLGVAGFLMIYYFKKHEKGYVLLSLVLGFTIAGITELLQLIPDGRYCSFNDVLIDFSGYALANILLLLLYSSLNSMKNKKAQAI